MSVIDRLRRWIGRAATDAADDDHRERAERVRAALADAERARAVARRLEMEARVFAGSPRREGEP